MTDIRTVAPIHHPSVSESPWDAATHIGRLPSPMPVSTAQRMYAWYDAERVEDGEIVKDACSLPHHEVSTSGAPGAANLPGVRNALARLPQSNIPADDHDRVRAHLQAHLDDKPEEDSMHDLALPPAVTARLTEGFGPEALKSPHRGFDIVHRGRRLEHRATRRVELRQEESGPVIDGYATVYEYPYEVWGGPPFGWIETIAEGACARSIANQDDVYEFFDHEGLPLAATKGGTLTLQSDSIGLHSVARPDIRSPWSMEIVSRLERGEIDAMSFAFKVLRQEWDGDYINRRITEVKLFDVSVVSFPANPATVVGIRATRSDPVRTMSLQLARAYADRLRQTG
jgi:HK97 family phage prohead protease